MKSNHTLVSKEIDHLKNKSVPRVTLDIKVEMANDLDALDKNRLMKKYF